MPVECGGRPIVTYNAHAESEPPFNQVSPRGRSQSNRDLKDFASLAWVVGLFTVCLLFAAERQKDGERDFVYFYGTGQIAVQHAPDQIYNTDLQLKTFQQIHPLKGNWAYGPSPYPPFIPLFFELFGHLPFKTAFHLWQICTLALFFGGVSLLTTTAWPNQRLVHSLIFASAFSFSPFCVDTLATGQLSAIGCFAFCVAFAEDGKGRSFTAGLALSLALYKPTLLLIVLPMLLVRKQWRTLAGMMAGGTALFALVTAFWGLAVWRAYLNMLIGLSRLHAALDFSRYIDAFAFFTLLTRHHSALKDLLVTCMFVCAGTCLFIAWKRSSNRKLIWSATIVWTLILNVYVPIYDSMLVIPSVLWSASDLMERYRRLFTTGVLALFASSWITELVARIVGIQILSIVLATFGILQLSSALRGSVDNDPNPLGRSLPEASAKRCEASPF